MQNQKRKPCAEANISKFLSSHLSITEEMMRLGLSTFCTSDSEGKKTQQEGQ